MLDSFTFSDSLSRDQYSDRLLAESFTFSEDMVAGRGGWFTRGLQEIFGLTENFVVTGEGVDFGTVAATFKKLVRAGKEFCIAAYQFVTSYGATPPADTDPMPASADDLSKRYPE